MNTGGTLRIDLDETPDAFERTEIITVHIGNQPHEVTIRAAGWEDVLAEWKRSNPRPLPPYTDKIVKHDSEEARRFRVLKSGITTWRDYNPQDQEYLRLLNIWNDESNYILAAHALQLSLVKGGAEITDLGMRAKALRSAGLSTIAAAQVFGHVLRISKLEDAELVDFFGKPSEQESS